MALRKACLILILRPGGAVSVCPAQLVESTIPSVNDGADVLYVSKRRMCEVSSPIHPPVLFDYPNPGNVNARREGSPGSGEVCIDLRGLRRQKRIFPCFKLTALFMEHLS